MSEGTPPPGAEPLHPKPPTPLPPPKEKGASELTLRLLSASILVPFFTFVIVQGGLWVLGTVVVMILIGLRELYGLIEEKGAQPLTTYGMIGGALLPVVAYVGNEYHATILMTAVLIGVMIAQLGKPQIGEAMVSVSGTFFGVFYVGWLLSHAVVLREFESIVTSKWPAATSIGFSPDVGSFLMLWTIAVLVLCDAGAYFAGKSFGKRKLAPRISPGKSVEGAIGGVVVGTLGGLAWKGMYDFLWPHLSHGFTWEMAAGFAPVIAVVGIIGDLMESLLKRDAKRKDAGALIPGMGGLLDRIDSPLIGIPVMYYMLLAYVFVQVG